MSETLTAKRSISKADILPAAEYAKIRVESRQRIARLKTDRRVEVGPCATFYFESWDTVWHQIQEMLHIEKGGDAQLEDEIEAYAPLVPKGDQLIATVMFEIDEPMRRATILSRIGGIEHRVFLRVGADKIYGVPDPLRENTSPQGKASSVQFITFNLMPAMSAAFIKGDTEIQLGFDHPNYGHVAIMPEAVRKTLAGDL